MIGWVELDSPRELSSGFPGLPAVEECAGELFVDGSFLGLLLDGPSQNDRRLMIVTLEHELTSPLEKLVGIFFVHRQTIAPKDHAVMV